MGRTTRCLILTDAFDCEIKKWLGGNRNLYLGTQNKSTLPQNWLCASTPVSRGLRASGGVWKPSWDLSWGALFSDLRAGWTVLTIVPGDPTVHGTARPRTLSPCPQQWRTHSFFLPGLVVDPLGLPLVPQAWAQQSIRYIAVRPPDRQRTADEGRRSPSLGQTFCRQQQVRRAGPILGFQHPSRHSSQDEGCHSPNPASQVVHESLAWHEDHPARVARRPGPV